MYVHHVSFRQSVEEIRLGKEYEEGGTRRERMKRGRSMKDRVDKSRGMETLIDETFAKIKPTESLRLAKQTE
jgi:hypothetical protein